MTTNTNGRFMRGLVLGSAILGLGYYLSRNKQLTEQLSLKLKEGLDTFSGNTGDLQGRLNTMVTDSKSTLNDNIEKTRLKVNDTVTRLTNAFNAGRTAAQENLRSSRTEFGSSSGSSDLSARRNVESPLGAVEDTTVENTSTVLHPSSNNIAQNVGDAGTMFEERTGERTTYGKGRDRDINQGG